MSTESGGHSDNEAIGSLVSKFPTEACSNPSKILARRVDTKQVVPATGWIQTLASYDVKKGFQCQQSLQQDGSPCHDYEVQLCCPGEKTESSRCGILGHEAKREKGEPHCPFTRAEVVNGTGLG